ncbi:MAG: excinuclease ABC subunit UvrC [Bacillota bacterium]
MTLPEKSGPLREKLRRLPDKPGIYLMKNASGEIIYVGKAVSLKNRVRSYFQAGQKLSPKVLGMVKHIDDLDYILTDSEVEALILENNLIKKHRPKYNIRLKDDKTYPYLKVTVDEDFPRIFMTRRVLRDGAKYYGPYTDIGAVKETLHILRKIFPLRTCKKKSVEREKRPCLNYHIKQCLAPCAGKVEPARYGGMVREISLFLEGRQEDLIKQLGAEMEKAAAELQFERAAELRDRVQALQKVVEKQKIVTGDLADQDVIAMAREGEETCVQAFFIRGGKLLGREHYILDETGGLSGGEVLNAFIKQYYNQVEYIPGEILLPCPLEEEEVITLWLGEKRGGRVRFRIPQRGEKLRLLELVEKNAAEQLAHHRAQREREQARTLGAMDELQLALSLPGRPWRIECFDISNTQGTESVGSMVVFERSIPKNEDYRRFKIKTVEGPNDFASMQEVIRRRFSRALKEQEAIKTGKLAEEKAKFAVLPDLVIIDGGKGQLNAAREAMRELGFGAVPTFGLAKENEWLFAENRPDPIILARNSEGLYLIQRVRDEAHRFAITYHRKLRGQRNLRSLLDDIPGVGPKRRKALLEHFRSMTRLKQAAVDELAEVDGISRALAEEIFEYFQSED